MPGTLTLTPDQLDEFGRRGVLRLGGLLSEAGVRRAREHVHHRLGNRHPAVEALVNEPALLSAVEALLGTCRFDRAMSGGPQILFTPPGSGTWTVPRTGWHVDIPRLASGRCPGVQLFACLDTVAPRGGGTLIVAGSHRLLNDGRFIRSRELKRLLARDAFFRDLYSEAPRHADERARLLAYAGAVRDVALEVMELAGQPGDAYLTDLRVLHAGSPNRAARPRTMVTRRFIRTDVVAELTEGYGWSV